MFFSFSFSVEDRGIELFQHTQNHRYQNTCQIVVIQNSRSTFVLNSTSSKTRKQVVDYIVWNIPRNSTIIFVLFVNSLLFMEKRAKIISFVGDILLTYEHNSWEEVMRITFIKMKCWSRANKCTMNLDKMKYLNFWQVYKS